MYVHERFDVEPLDLAFICTKWEGFCVKISQSEPYVKQHIIGNIYKPPFEGLEDFNLFLTEFHDFVNMLSNYGHSSYICGDFNINLLKIGIKSHYNTFFENMLSYGFYPKITLPTQICNTSSTIIDNIFSNEICSNDASGIFINHISDHQTIFTITPTKLNDSMEQQYVSIETKDDVSLNNFITEVRNMDIPEILNKNINANLTENYELFSKLVQEAKSKHLPIKRIKFNKYKHKKCRWITNGILKSIKPKDIIYKKLKQVNPANVEAFEILKTRFNRVHNILRQSIKEAKQIYYLRNFEKFKHDTKQTWSVINETLHRKKKKSLPRVFSHNGRLLKEPVEIANAFNRYFMDIGPSLANQIHTHHNYKEYLRNPSKNQIALQPIEEYKVI